MLTLLMLCLHFWQVSFSTSFIDSKKQSFLSLSTEKKPPKGRVAPGPYHGDDPHDEVHDKDLPANKDYGLYPSSDPYNDTTKNDKDHPYRPY